MIHAYIPARLPLQERLRAAAVKASTMELTGGPRARVLTYSGGSEPLEDYIVAIGIKPAHLIALTDPDSKTVVARLLTFGICRLFFVVLRAARLASLPPGDPAREGAARDFYDLAAAVQAPQNFYHYLCESGQDVVAKAFAAPDPGNPSAGRPPALNNWKLPLRWASRIGIRVSILAAHHARHSAAVHAIACAAASEGETWALGLAARLSPSPAIPFVAAAIRSLHLPEAALEVALEQHGAPGGRR